jgi:hypothetical protein
MNAILFLMLSAAAAATPAPRPTPLVISDANLAALAARGRFANPVAPSSPGQAPPALDLAAIEAAAVARAERRAAWTKRLAAQLAEVRRLEREVEEQRVAAGWLWIRYLRTQKEFTRERRVRPKLVAARQRLAELEQDLAAAHTSYDELCEAARRDGAEPGWFRDLEAADPP